ncbi:hypothetical protein HQ520_05780 [bacterium]|nr:hypothetical protein [bacterium]
MVLSSMLTKGGEDRNTIGIAFQSQSPRLAQEFLDTLIRLYQVRHIEVHVPSTPPAFFRERAALVESQIQEKEQQLKDLERENSITDIGTQKGLLLNQIARLQQSIAEASVEEKASASRIDRLRLSITEEPEQIVLSEREVVNQAYVQSLSDLNNLRTQEVEMASRYPDEARPLRDTRSQISQLEKALAGQEETRRETTWGANGNRQLMVQALQNELTNIEAHRALQSALKEELVLRRAELVNLNNLEVQLARLARDLELGQGEYEAYLKQMRVSDISMALDREKISNLSVIQSATLPTEPVKPRRALIMALGLFGGIFGGLVLAFLLEYLDHTIKTNEDLTRRLGVPVLATVSAKQFKALR